MHHGRRSAHAGRSRRGALSRITLAIVSKCSYVWAVHVELACERFILQCNQDWHRSSPDNTRRRCEVGQRVTGFVAEVFRQFPKTGPHRPNQPNSVVNACGTMIIYVGSIDCFCHVRCCGRCGDCGAAGASSGHWHHEAPHTLHWQWVACRCARVWFSR